MQGCVTLLHLDDWIRDGLGWQLMGSVGYWEVGALPPFFCAF